MIASSNDIETTAKTNVDAADDDSDEDDNTV